MILVDTSVWIDFFSRSPGRGGVELSRMIEEAEPFALAGIIVTEILQGLRRNADRIERYLSLWDVLEPVGFSTYREAAAIARHARSKGVSLSTIDCLITAIAIEHRAILFSLDKDFLQISRFTPLQLHSPGASTK